MSKILYKLYTYLPVWIQNIGISIFGISWYYKRFGGIFKNEIIKFKKRETYSEDEFEKYKIKELRKIILHSIENVPYYKKLYEINSITKYKIKSISISDLKNLPFLEKQDLRLYGKTSLISEGFDKNGDYYSSSGSSGTPTNIYISKNTHRRWSAAFEVRIRNWAGINYKTARGMIGGRRVLPNANDGPPYYRYNIVEKQVYYSAYHISPNTVYNYIYGMKKHKIEYMNGYAVSNYLLASFIKKKGLDPPKLKAVITSSEKLTTEMREVLEDVYKCKTYDSWSGVEACALVSECEYGKLHISEDVGIIEILDEQGNEVSDGESGEVVCTGFLNYDQPLIRYRIGDRMTKGIGKCKCGRNMPIIKEIDGRIEDVITGPDGRKMVRFHSVFIGISSIECTQVIQQKIDYILIKIQNEIELTNKEIRLIKDRVISQLGDVNIDIQQQTKIEQTNGKYKAVISNLK